MAVTADAAYPFDAGDGSAIAESQWRDMAKHWLPSGPLITDLAPSSWGVLQPSAGVGLQVLVAAGSAWIRGHYGEWTSQSALTITSNASGSTRVDAIVARVDFVGNDIELDVVAGTPGAGVPALTQNTSVWEILLGTSTLTSGGSSVTVADSRQCVGYSDTTYTPTVRYGTTAATVSNLNARVIRRDGLVHVRMYGQITSLNGGTGDLNVSLPTAARTLVTLGTVPTDVGSFTPQNNVAGTFNMGRAILLPGDTGYVYGVPYDGNQPTLYFDHSSAPATVNVRLHFEYEAAN